MLVLIDNAGTPAESGDLRVELRVLGPMAVILGGRSESVPTPMLRRLLALMSAQAGSPVSHHEIADALWSGHPPVSARGTLHAYVSRLRKLLGADCLRREGECYVLSPTTVSVDSVAFCGWAAEASAARERDDPHTAVAAASEGLRLWHGEAFQGFHDLIPVETAARRLEDLRLATFEDMIETLLRTQSVLSAAHHYELGVMSEQHPFREKLRGFWMLSLYCTGRRVDALAAYQQTYRRLREDLALKPSQWLAQLNDRIIADDLPPFVSGHLVTAGNIGNGTA